MGENWKKKFQAISRPFSRLMTFSWWWRSTWEMTFALRWTSSRDSDRAASMRAISYKCISVERRRVYWEGCPNHMQMRIRKIMRNVPCLGASMAPARWHLPSPFPPPPQAQSRARIGAPAPLKPVTKVQHCTLSPSPPGQTLPASCIPTHDGQERISGVN